MTKRNPPYKEGRKLIRKGLHILVEDMTFPPGIDKKEYEDSIIRNIMEIVNMRCPKPETNPKKRKIVENDSRYPR